MLLTDTSKLLQKLWERPAENNSLIITLNSTWNSGPTIYSRSEDGLDGVVAVQEFPYGKCASVEVDSADLAEELLIEAGLDDSWRVVVSDPEVIEMLERAFGFTTVSGVVRYAVDKESFHPCEVGGCVKRVTPNAAPRLQEFAKGEADDHLMHDTQGDYGSGGVVAYYCEDSGAIVGYIDAGVHVDSLWEIGYIYVTPDQRGKGYARMLASAVTSHLLDSDRIPIYSVSAENIASAKTCESIGYQVCGRCWAMEKKQ